MAASNGQQPALTFPCKLTEEASFSLTMIDHKMLINSHAQIDLVSAIRDHALHAFSQSNDPESHPDALAADAKKLQDLRKSATLSSEGSDGSTLPSGMLDRMILYVHVPSCTKEKAKNASLQLPCSACLHPDQVSCRCRSQSLCPIQDSLTDMNTSSRIPYCCLFLP